MDICLRFVGLLFRQNVNISSNPRRIKSVGFQFHLIAFLGSVLTFHYGTDILNDLTTLSTENVFRNLNQSYQWLFQNRAEIVYQGHFSNYYFRALEILGLSATCSGYKYPHVKSHIVSRRAQVIDHLIKRSGLNSKRSFFFHDLHNLRYYLTLRPRHLSCQLTIIEDGDLLLGFAVSRTMSRVIATRIQMGLLKVYQFGLAKSLFNKYEMDNKCCANKNAGELLPISMNMMMTVIILFSAWYITIAFLFAACHRNAFRRFKRPRVDGQRSISIKP